MTHVTWNEVVQKDSGGKTFVNAGGTAENISPDEVIIIISSGLFTV